MRYFNNNGKVMGIESDGTQDHLIKPDWEEISESQMKELTKATPSAKEMRDLALASLSYDFGDGRVIQTRPKDELNITTAIEVMETNDINSIDWVMVDNTKHPVTVNELKEALNAGRLAGLAIWDNYDPE